MSERVLAWHFLTNDRLPGHGRRKRPLEVGDVMRVKGPPVLCDRGLHASERVLDALSYAPGPVVCRVVVSGRVVRGGDKLVGTRRKILGMADATTVLHEFACDVVEKVMHQYSITDERCWAAVELKRRWIRGEAADEALAAAEAAARTAARTAARAASGAAVWYAAWVVAREELNADLESRLLRLLRMEEVE